MNLLVGTPMFKLSNDLQVKQDSTYLTLINKVGNGHAVEIDAALGYSRDGWSLVCDVTYIDNLTGKSYTAKYDIIVRKNRKIVIPFIVIPDVPYQTVDGVAIRSKHIDAPCIEGYCTNFSLVAFTYITGLTVNYKHFSKKEVTGKVILPDIYLTYFKGNVA